MDAWLRTQNTVGIAGGGGGGGGGLAGENFVLGLELLDLSDFEARAGFVRIGTPEEEVGEEDVVDGFDDMVKGLSLGNASLASPEASPEAEREAGEQGERDGTWDGDVEGEGEIIWTRACRCGAEQGFRIREAELEAAEGRGEREVLVGCEGCSLWVRVGFDVEVEG